MHEQSSVIVTFQRQKDLAAQTVYGGKVSVGGICQAFYLTVTQLDHKSAEQQIQLLVSEVRCMTFKQPLSQEVVGTGKAQ